MDPKINKHSQLEPKIITIIDPSPKITLIKTPLNNPKRTLNIALALTRETHSKSILIPKFPHITINKLIGSYR